MNETLIVPPIGCVVEIEPIELAGTELENMRIGRVAFLTTIGILSIVDKVIDALAIKFDEYDALMFDATMDSNDPSDLKAIYLWVVGELTRTTNAKVYDQKTNYGNAFLVSKVDISSVDFVNETIEYLKTVDWNTVPSLPTRN